MVNALSLVNLTWFSRLRGLLRYSAGKSESEDALSDFLLDELSSLFLHSNDKQWKLEWGWAE